MSGTRILPPWADDLRRRYLRGESAMFVLHGNVYDTVVHQQRLFGLTSYFSTLFSDQWKPLLAGLCVAGALAAVEQAWVVSPRLGLFRVMSGELYFRSGELPWPGLLGSMALTAGLLYASARNLAARDF